MSTNGSLLPNQLNIQGLEQKSFQMSVHHLKQQICFCFYFVNEKRKRKKKEGKAKQNRCLLQIKPVHLYFCIVLAFFFVTKFHVKYNQFVVFLFAPTSI